MRSVTTRLLECALRDGKIRPESRSSNDRMIVSVDHQVSDAVVRVGGAYEGGEQKRLAVRGELHHLHGCGRRADRLAKSVDGRWARTKSVGGIREIDFVFWIEPNLGVVPTLSRFVDDRREDYCGSRGIELGEPITSARIGAVAAFCV